MSTDAERRQELLERIKMKRASISAFVGDLRPRADRLTNLSIICSAVVAALTAGPALGGTRFTGGAANMFGFTEDSLVWRILCFAALVLSIVAAISTNLYKSHDLSNRLARAEASNAGLEGLEALVEFGRLPTTEAVEQYQRYIADIPFIPDRPPQSG